ncbi:MAG TPA: type II secretion system protein M [Gammaproteobacteria bacterium]|nr:type II secretion system protein M [Gammaproteobacteria bacterium]
MKERWQQLAPREKQLLILMSVVVLITLFYFALWKPLKTGIEDGQLRLRAQTHALIKIRQQAAEVRQLRSTGAGKQTLIEDSSSLLGLIERSAKQKNINGNLQKVQPEGQREVRVWMENVSFDQLISWLDLLSSRYAIQITEISVEHGNTPGIVNSRILLQAP